MPAIRKPIEVILEESQSGRSVPYFFVLITNIPYVTGRQKACCIREARPRHQAEAIKAAVEQALHDYRMPKPRKRRRAKKPKTSWERITKERGSL
jgi:hypothetical protein